MVNSRHLKRTSMPTSWNISRKAATFIAKPNPGSMNRKYVVSLVVLLREVMGVATTAKEAKFIAHNEEVSVNSKVVKDIKAPIGMFDVVAIKSTSQKFTILFDELGKVKLVPVKDDLIYLKVSGKVTLGAKKFQLNFMNGFNLIVDEKTAKSVKVADTVVFDTAKKKVEKVLNLKEGAQVYVFDGKFKGKLGEIKSFTHYSGVTRDVAQITIGKVEHNTAKDYCYVVGAKKEDLKRFE